MKDEKGSPPSNVINLIPKQSGPNPLTPAMIFQGLELVRAFLTISRAERREQVVEFAKRIAAEDANVKS